MALYPPDVHEFVEEHDQHLCERCGRVVSHDAAGVPQPHYRPVRPRTWCQPRPPRPRPGG